MPAVPAVLLRTAERELAGAGVASPRQDAEALLDHVLGGTARFTLTAVPPEDSARYRDLVHRRVGREPLQHILGVAGFRRLTLAVGPGVFVPRPETESLVGWALSLLAGRSAPLVVDLCAGTGAIGLAVAAEHPGARVHAVELDGAALGWLRRNAAAWPEVSVVRVDATDPATLRELDGTVDLVLANPPYVPDGTPVPPEVDHDPAIAVWGGPDGLTTVRKVSVRAAALLRPGGWFGVEHDETRGAEARAILAAAGLVAARTHADLAGRPRFSTARRER
ncbi:MAG: peptide chain release factor N(5)-glutamine methyltransferase [Actinobacteria bacterium]|nr:peptide chain release factor N(5)-glutamine methyltransferase [Actinomycetota bacterium]